MGNGERLVNVGSVELCVETFGDPADPAILLIAGSSTPMDAWADGFCDLLAAGNRHVIRYDNRDTGRSTSFPAGAPGYGFDDVVADAVGLLDALNVERAHLVGMSMGGGIAMSIALQSPGRAASLTLMSTTPKADWDPIGPALPPPSAAFLAFCAQEHPEPDWNDRTSYVEHFAMWERQYAGPRYFQETASRAYAGRVFDRTRDIKASSRNHGLARPPRPQPHRLGDITAPTLVVHGTVDPILPPGHAEALVREIPGSRLLLLEGVGHQMPPPALWELVATAILDHTGMDAADPTPPGPARK